MCAGGGGGGGKLTGRAMYNRITEEGMIVSNIKLNEWRSWLID